MDNGRMVLLRAMVETWLEARSEDVQNKGYCVAFGNDRIEISLWDKEKE